MKGYIYIYIYMKERKEKKKKGGLFFIAFCGGFKGKKLTKAIRRGRFSSINVLQDLYG